MSKSRQTDVSDSFQDVMVLQDDKKKLNEFQELILSLEENLKLKTLVEEYMFTLYKVDGVDKLKYVLKKQLETQEVTQSRPTLLKYLEERILEIAPETSELLKRVKAIAVNAEYFESEDIGKRKYLFAYSIKKIERFSAIGTNNTELPKPEYLSDGSKFRTQFSEQDLGSIFSIVQQTEANRKQMHLENVVSMKQSILTKMLIGNNSKVSQLDAILKHWHRKDDKLKDVTTKQLEALKVTHSHSKHLSCLEEIFPETSKCLNYVKTTEESVKLLEYIRHRKGEYLDTNRFETTEQLPSTVTGINKTLMLPDYTSVGSTTSASSCHGLFLDSKSKDTQWIEVDKKIMHWRSIESKTLLTLTSIPNENKEMDLQIVETQMHRHNGFEFDVKSTSNEVFQKLSKTQDRHVKGSTDSLLKIFETKEFKHEEKAKPHIRNLHNSSISNYDFDTEEEDVAQNEIKFDLLTKDKLKYFGIPLDPFNRKELFIKLFGGFKTSDKMQLFKTNKPMTEILKNVKIRFGDDLGTVAENLANPVVVIQMYSSVFQSSQEIPGEIEGRLTITKRELQMNVVKASMFEDAISSTVTLGDLTYTLWFPSNCRLFESIPVLRGSFIHRKDQQLNNLPPQNI